MTLVYTDDLPGAQEVDYEDADWEAFVRDPAQSSFLRFTCQPAERAFAANQASQWAISSVIASTFLLCFFVYLWALLGDLRIALPGSVVVVAASCVLIGYYWRPVKLPWWFLAVPKARISEAAAVALCGVIASIAVLQYLRSSPCINAALGDDEQGISQDAAIRQCTFAFFGSYCGAGILALRPRFVFVVPLAVVQFVGSCIGAGISSAPTQVWVLQQLVHAATLLAVVGCVFALERHLRARFRVVVAARCHDAALLRNEATTDSILRQAVPAGAAVQLRRVLRIDEAMVENAAASASVGVSAISDFAHWSTGLLPVHVVLVLHRLFALCDEAAVNFGVAKVTTSGDAYTVVGGLLQSSEAPAAARHSESVPTHPAFPAETNAARAAVNFCMWEVQCAAQAVAQSVNVGAVSIRAAVATGPVFGGIAGHTESLRYVIGGAAVARARGLLRTAAPGSVSADAPTMVHLAKQPPQAPPLPPSARTQAPPSPRPPLCGATVARHADPADGADEVEMVPVGAASDTAPLSLIPPHMAAAERRRASPCRQGDGLRLTRWLLLFADPEVEDRYRDFAAAADQQLCAVSAGLLGTMLALATGVVLAEHLILNIDGLGGGGFQAAAFPVCLFAMACVLQGVRVAMMLARWPRPSLGADHVASLVSGFAAAAAVYLVEDSIATRQETYLVLGWTVVPFGLAQVRYWPVSAATTCTVVVAITTARILRSGVSVGGLDESAAGGAFAANLAVTYLIRRGLRAAFALRRRAEALSAAAHHRQALMAELLRALLPPHVAASEVERRLEEGPVGPAGPAEGVPHRIEEWGALVIVNARVHSPPTAAAETLSSAAALHRLLGSAVKAVAGGSEAGAPLQLVEIAGDDFTAAGPFLARGADEAGLAAADSATRALQLMRALATPPHPSLTAMLSCGPAFSALLGAERLTYRLFGPSVREARALLEAAPDPLLPGRSAAFATPSFRRALPNATNQVPVLGDPNMSLGLSRAVFGASALPVDGRRLMKLAGTEGHADEKFTAALRWRARGAGVVMVSSIRLYDDVPGTNDRAARPTQL